MPKRESASPKKPPKPAGLNGTGTASKNSHTSPSAEQDYTKGYDILVVNGDVDSKLFSEILRCITDNRKNYKLVISITTYGGLANDAYRIGRFLHTAYDEIVAFVPSLCKSAGTLIVTSAHAVLISPFGEIGPLDVQLRQKDELFERRSGLTTRAALIDLKAHAFDLFEEYMLGMKARSQGSVSFKLAAEISGQVAGRLISGIYSQINPEALGQDYRDLAVATQYGERLARLGKNLNSEAIARLVHDYPSHDFVIDLFEAKEIFNNVAVPPAALFEIIQPHLGDMMTPKNQGRLVKMLTPIEEVKIDKEDDHAEKFQEQTPPNGEASPAIEG